MSQLPNCPKCNSEYVYEDGTLLVCPECAYEWNPAEQAEVQEGVVAIDANGNKLADGDTVHAVNTFPKTVVECRLNVSHRCIITAIQYETVSFCEYIWF